MQSRIQACLDQTQAAEPDKWLEVVNWFREAMLPNGVATSRTTLDTLKTRRPIFVMSSFGHTALVNTRALQLAKPTASTPDPLGGRIERESSGAPSGILEDAAPEKVTAIIPKATPAEDLKAAAAALDAMPTFLDAMATPQTLAAFAAAGQQRGLTARAHFAVLITPEQGRDPKQAVATAWALARKYDQGEARAAGDHGTQHQAVRGRRDHGARLHRRHAESLLRQCGHCRAATLGAGQESRARGLFPRIRAAPASHRAARAGLEPHMHADGDRAVHEALDGVAALRRVFPGSAIRAAIAHDEIVDPADFPRYQQLDAIPVLSFQWEKPAPDTTDGAQDYLGPQRFKYLEPAGYLAAAGARIAYGSDWPVDPLNEWFALKVAVTRENDPAAGAKYAGRLSSDTGLTLPAAIRAITANSSYELHAEHEVGLLEVGKLADFIVLDRNVFKIPAQQVAQVKVLLTVVGGKAVHGAAPFAAAAVSRVDCGRAGRPPIPGASAAVCRCATASGPRP